MGEIVSLLNESFNICSDFEMTLEGTPLDFLNQNRIQTLKKIGFNRVSLGVQSFDSGLMSSLGRPISSQKIVSAIDQISKAGDLELNIDMMYGFTNMSLEVLKSDIAKVISLPVDSCDYYAFMPILGTKAQEVYLDSELPQALEKQRKTVLESFAGWSQISTEAFGRNLRTSKRVWQRSFGGNSGKSTVLALGSSSYGTINGHYYHNVYDLNCYNELIEQKKFPLRCKAHLKGKTFSRKLLIGRILMGVIYHEDLEKFSNRESKLISAFQENGVLEEDNQRNLILSKAGQIRFTDVQACIVPVSEAIVLLNKYMLSYRQQQKYLLDGTTRYLQTIRKLGLLGEGRHSWFFRLVMRFLMMLPKKVYEFTISNLEKFCRSRY